MKKVVTAFVLGSLAGFAVARWTSEDRGPDGVVDEGDARAGDSSDDGIAGGADSQSRDAVRAAVARRARRNGDTTNDEAEAGVAGAGVGAAGTTERHPPAPQGGTLLDRIAAEARSPSPPGDGLRVFNLAGEYAKKPGTTPVDLDLLRALFAGPGHSGQAARVLFQFAEPTAAAAELRRMIAGGERTWPNSMPGEVVVALLRVAARALTDEDVSSLFGPGDAAVRLAALGEAKRRGLHSADALLRISRTDPLRAVRVSALEGLVAGIAAGTSDRAVVAAEVLLIARDPGHPIHETAIHALCEIGPAGADLAAELIVGGGLPPGLVESVAQTLVTAGRFDALAGARLSGESASRLLGVIEEALYDEKTPVDRAAVVRLLRTLPLPESPELAWSYFYVALAADASDIALGAARRSDVAAWLRVVAANAITESSRPEDVTPALDAARAVLETDPVDASRRREFIESSGSDLAEHSEEGRALVTRISEQDPDPWVRREAARILRDLAAR